MRAPGARDPPRGGDRARIPLQRMTSRIRSAVMRAWTWRQWLVGIIYLLVGLVLISCMFAFVKDYLPASVASRVSHNSEGYVIALIVIPWIQFVRGRLAGLRRRPHLQHW